MGKLPKLPYVNEYQIFVRVEYKLAEEILAEYNDFYIFNLAEYNAIYYNQDETFEDNGDDTNEEERIAIADRNAKNATDHFTALFGSKDFCEGSLVGFRPAWYDLQRILLEEYKNKTDIKDSAMNGIAPTLRNTASILLFAERMVSGLSEHGGTPEQITAMKSEFESLLQKNDQLTNMPEYWRAKKEISKFRKPEQYIEFCKALFEAK